MRTPWDVARFAAAALANGEAIQSWCASNFDAPLAVYLGGAGTDYKSLPRPFAVVRVAGAEDGAKSADTVDLLIVVGVDSSLDPATGAEADLTKPAPMPDGVRLVGRGADLILLAGIAADEAKDALPDCVVEKRAFRYTTGEAPVEVAACVLTVAPGIGFWNPDEAAIEHLPPKPPQET